MSVRIVYRDIAPGAAEDASVSAAGADAASDLSLLPFGPEGETKYAALEHNLWLLDGGYAVGDTAAVPFRSAAASDGNGEFRVPPVITVTFTQRYTSLGLTVDFDPDGRCDRISVAWYQGGALLLRKSFSPDADAYFCESTTEAYDKIVITLLRTAAPGRRARIRKLTFGALRSFERDELRSVRAVLEIDPTSRELASNTLDWTLSGTEAVEYIFQRKQPVLAYDGERLIGAFYIADSSRRARTLYDITCTDAVGVLDGEAWPDAVYSGANALALAEAICAPFAVEMDDALKSETVSGVLRNETRRSALQQLCLAIGAAADTSGSEAVRIFKVRDSGARAIAAERTRVGGAVETADLVTAVTVVSHSYSTAGSTGAVEIGGVKYYDTKTSHTLRNPAAVSSDKPNTVEVKNATLVSEANAEAVLDNLYDFCQKRQTHNLRFRLEGESVGDAVRTVTPWGTTVGGVLRKLSVTLSGIALADAEVVGMISDGIEPAYPFSGTMYSGEIRPYLGGG